MIEGSKEFFTLILDRHTLPHSRSFVLQRFRLMTAADAALDPSTSIREERKEGSDGGRYVTPHVNVKGGSLLQTE